MAEITSINSGTSAEQLEVYLSVGIVNGFTSLLSGVTFDPKLMSLSTNTGSEAGATIRATIAGAGVNDELTLVKNSGSESICETSTVIEYGVLECVTKAEAITLTTIGVRDTANGQSYSCANSDTSQCQY